AHARVMREAERREDEQVLDPLVRPHRLEQGPWHRRRIMHGWARRPARIAARSDAHVACPGTARADDARRVTAIAQRETQRQVRVLAAYAAFTYPFACVPFLWFYFRDHGIGID